MALPNLSGLRLGGHGTLDELEPTGVLGVPGAQSAIRKARNTVRSGLIRAGIQSTGYAALRESIRAHIRMIASITVDCGCDLVNNLSIRQNPQRKQAVSLMRAALSNLADAPFIVQETTGVPAAHLGHRLDAAIASDLASKYFEAQKLYHDPEQKLSMEQATMNIVSQPDDALIQNAVETAFKFFQDDGSVRRLRIDVRLMQLDSENYTAGINEGIHMDDAYGSVGSTYGLTAEDREPYFLITSFCADESANVSLRECGTRLLEGVPVIHPRSIRDAAAALHQNSIFQTLCTERELFATLARRCNEATDRALSKFTEDALQNMGIRFRSSPMLDWTYLNTLTYHRSPNRSEVLETAQTRHGMRGFVAILKEPSDSEFGANPNERVFHIKTPMNHPLTVMVELFVSQTGDWTMAEDNM